MKTWFKKWSQRRKGNALEKRWKKLLAEASRWSKTDRKRADGLLAEAAAVEELIVQLKMAQKAQ